MKRLASLILGLGLSLPLLAAPKAYIDAVVQSPAMKRVLDAASGDNTDIISITNTAVYRCPGCYKFEMKFYKKSGRGEDIQTAVFETRLKDFSSQEIIVTDMTPE